MFHVPFRPSSWKCKTTPNERKRLLETCHFSLPWYWEEGYDSVTYLAWSNFTTNFNMKNLSVSSVRPRDPESCESILRPSCSHPRMFLIQNEDEEGHMRRGKTFKTSQNETIHAMVIWNNSQHGSYNLVSFKPLELCIPEKTLLHRTSKILLLKKPSHLYDCAAFPVERRTNSLKSNRPFWFTFVGAIGSRHLRKFIESTENSDIDSSNR